MSLLFEILSQRLDGEIADDGIVTENDIATVEKRIERVIPQELAHLLLAANGLTFEPAARFQDCEILGFLSLWGIERTLQTEGEYIPPFILPFAHSLCSLFCVDSSGLVYTVTGIGDQIPRILIEPSFLSMRMFCERLQPLI